MNFEKGRKMNIPKISNINLEWIILNGINLNKLYDEYDSFVAALDLLGSYYDIHRNTKWLEYINRIVTNYNIILNLNFPDEADPGIIEFRQDLRNKEDHLLEYKSKIT